MALTGDIRDRLEQRCATGPAAPLHQVRLAASALAVAGELKAPVEAWVLSWDSVARPPAAATGVLRQLDRESVIVLIGFLYAGAAGAPGAVEPEEVQDAVIEALLGWVPPGRASPLELRGSRLLSFDGARGTLFRQVVFETQRFRSAVVG
jgi:hypothetical protein